MFVLDCSVTMAWCFEDEKSDYADKILQKLNKEVALVPPLWHLEVLNVLLVAERRERIKADKSKEFISLLNQLNIQTDPEIFNLTDSSGYELAQHNQLSAYDMSYLALATREQLPIASCDKKLIEVSSKSKLWLNV